MNILAIDFGTKKFGFAISFFDIAMPYDSIIYENDFNIIKKIKEIIIDEKISLILLGIPLNKNNQDTERSILVRSFYEELKNEISNIKILLINEMNTTNKSIDSLKEYGYKNNKIKEKKDSVSAMNILNNYLDNKHGY